MSYAERIPSTPLMTIKGRFERIRPSTTIGEMIALYEAVLDKIGAPDPTEDEGIAFNGEFLLRAWLDDLWTFYGIARDWDPVFEAVGCEDAYNIHSPMSEFKGDAEKAMRLYKEGDRQGFDALWREVSARIMEEEDD